jgi:aldehyde dehydrogenase (NAD+)
LIELLKSGGKLRYGGDYLIEEKYVGPALIDSIDFSDKIMQDEIFGPLLPIITYHTFDEMIQTLQKRNKPLATYYFTHQKDKAEELLKTLSFGGGCINDCITQLTNWHLPFGGVGASGFGAYHGKTSFDTFSHYKSVFKRRSYFDYPFIYPPYQMKHSRWLKWILGW